MEGRRSRTKPAEVENAKAAPATPKSASKRAGTHVSPLQAKSAAKIAVTPHLDTVEIAVDDRCVPTVGGENKRKRAPRGPVGRNVKAKVENEDVNEDEAKIDFTPTAEEEGSFSNSGGNQVLRNQEDRSGTGNDEGGVNSKEQVERRRGSSRPRIRPSKFRESLPLSSSKVKGEVKSNEDTAKSSAVDILLPGNNNKGTPQKADNQTVQLVPSQVDTRELIAKILSSKKEAKSKSTPVKEKEPSTAIANVVPNSPNRAGLKAVLLALKRVMKMKEADPFNKPVDPVKLGIPDYLEVVKRPMDLGTIRDRLEKGEVYNTVNSVFEDVALVWSNCRQYNDDGDPIMGLLQNLESTFNKLCLAAGSPFQVPVIAEADSEKSKGEELPLQISTKVSKKKKAKDVQPDAGASLKTKIKRSAPVDQVMAESKAREQKGNTAEGLSLGDQDRYVINAPVNSNGATIKQSESPQAEQGSEDEETHGNSQGTPQGPVATPPVKEAGSAPIRYHRKSTGSQNVTMPGKVKRPNGHSTLTHRQGCLCVVCVGRRKREAKLRKSGAHLKAIKSAKKKSGGTNSGDMAVEADELASTEDAEDFLNGYPDNVQGYSANFHLPLRKMDPDVVEMSRILLGSKPGSIWNRPRSLGYVAAPLPAARRVGIADAIVSLSKSYLNIVQ